MGVVSRSRLGQTATLHFLLLVFAPGHTVCASQGADSGGPFAFGALDSSEAADVNTDDNSVDLVPVDHSTALAYLVSFGVILFTVLFIVAFTFIVKLRRRRAHRADIPRTAGVKGDNIGHTGGEKTSQIRYASQVTLAAPVRMASFYSNGGRMAQTCHQLHCRCPDCLVAFDMVGFHSTPARAVTRVSHRLPTHTHGHGHRDPYIPAAEPHVEVDENQQGHAGTPIPDRSPFSQRQYEWQLVHGLHESSLDSGSGTGIRVSAIGMSRLSQMSPLSSLTTSIFRVLESPAQFSDDSGSSLIKPSAIVPSKEPEEEPTKRQPDTHTAETDLAEPRTWISDADWIDDSAPVQLLYATATDGQDNSHGTDITPSKQATEVMSSSASADDNALRCMA